jgi:hypothetical protein
MAKQIINIGSFPNAKNGDSIRDAFNKVNQNFNELYQSVGFSGDYADLLNKPTIPTDISQLTDFLGLLGDGAADIDGGTSITIFDESATLDGGSSSTIFDENLTFNGGGA